MAPSPFVPARRVFLAGSAAAAVTAVVHPVSAAAVDPDAALTVLCAEFIACEFAHLAIYDGPNSIECDDEAGRAAAPITARMDVLFAEISAAQATTAAGLLAKVRALAAFGGHFGFSFDYQNDKGVGTLLRSVMRDAAALGGPLPHTIGHPVSWNEAEGGRA